MSEDRQSPVTCQAPECTATLDLVACQKLDSRLVCPKHRSVQDGVIVCVVCREKLDDLLRQQETVVAEKQAYQRAYDQRAFRRFFVESLLGFIPLIIGILFVVALIEYRFGGEYRQFYPFIGIAGFAGYCYSILFRSSKTTSRPDDFGSAWRADRTHER